MPYEIDDPEAELARLNPTRPDAGPSPELPDELCPYPGCVLRVHEEGDHAIDDELLTGTPADATSGPGKATDATATPPKAKRARKRPPGRSEEPQEPAPGGRDHELIRVGIPRPLYARLEAEAARRFLGPRVLVEQALGVSLERLEAQELDAWGALTVPAQTWDRPDPGILLTGDDRALLGTATTPEGIGVTYDPPLHPPMPPVGLDPDGHSIELGDPESPDR